MVRPWDAGKHLFKASPMFSTDPAVYQKITNNLPKNVDFLHWKVVALCVRRICTRGETESQGMQIWERKIYTYAFSARCFHRWFCFLIGEQSLCPKCVRIVYTKL